MLRIYHCSICNLPFATKSACQNHFRLECQQSVKLTNSEGFITAVERRERNSTWLFARIVVMHCPGNGSKGISRVNIKCQYEILSKKQANVEFEEENQDWLDEWLRDNPVKTLAECK
jgi:hypothetical protein